MPDFVSFNEFIDRTADARVSHHIETLRAGLARTAARKRGAARPAKGVAVNAAVSDAAAEEQFDKMKTYVLEYYKDVRSEHTFLDAAGNFIDCIPFEQQPTFRAAQKAGLHVPMAPPDDVGREPLRKGNPMNFGPESSHIISPLRREGVDLFGNRRACPEGTVPIRRITTARLAWHGRFENFFHKTPPMARAPSADKGRAGKKAGGAARRGSVKRGASGRTKLLPPPQSGPDGAGHLHAGCQTDPGTYYGGSAWLNIWDTDPSPSVFNLSQLWLHGVTTFPNHMQATIESGWMVEPNGLPYLFVFYNPDGYQNWGTPAQRAGYVNNQHLMGFVQYPGSGVYPGMVLDKDQVSVPGGKQYGINMGWDRDADGNWWLHAGYDKFEKVGCFPAGVYDENTGLSDQAGILQFGGEVASNGNGYGPMGSGVRPFPDPRNSFGQVAFQKLISVLTEVGGALEQPANLSTFAEGPNYTASADVSADWGNFFFFGGAHAP